MAADPVLVELDDDGVALLSDGSMMQFPAGTKFQREIINPEKPDHKPAQRVIPVSGGPSFVLIKGATRSTVENAIRRCQLGV